MYVVTRGSKSGNPIERTRELFESARFTHAKRLWVDNFEDTHLTVESRLVNHIEFFIDRSDPDIILTHAINDYHHDHRAVAECSLEAARNSQNVLAYEIPVTKEFTPQLYYDVSDVIEDKARLIDIFASQRGKSITMGSTVKGMAAYRALQSRLDSKVTHAEAFQVLKLCTNTDFGLMKLAKREMPPSILGENDETYKQVLEYDPYMGLPEMLRVLHPELSSIRVASSESPISNVKERAQLSSSVGSNQNSKVVSEVAVGELPSSQKE
jgi:LmbE family N-acetylglucosaminyl deacetylase